jgi:phosphoserine phosphatase
MKSSRKFPLAKEPTDAELRERAQRRIKIAEAQRKDAPLAMKEYREAEEAVRERTAKLRAARLAREAALKK